MQLQHGIKIIFPLQATTVLPQYSLFQAVADTLKVLQIPDAEDGQN